MISLALTCTRFWTLLPVSFWMTEPLAVLAFSFNLCVDLAHGQICGLSLWYSVLDTGNITCIVLQCTQQITLITHLQSFAAAIHYRRNKHQILEKRAKRAAKLFYVIYQWLLPNNSAVSVYFNSGFPGSCLKVKIPFGAFESKSNHFYASSTDGEY